MGVRSPTYQATGVVYPANCQRLASRSDRLRRRRRSADWYSQRSGKWILGNYGNTLYNHYYASQRPIDWDCMNQPQQKGQMAVRSNHPGGVNLLAATAARDLSPMRSTSSCGELATRDGGEADGGP